MDVHNLAKMANQIGSFFEAYPDREFAEGEIAGHIRKFWEPRMRSVIFDELETVKGELHPTVYAALLSLKSAH